MKKLLIMLMTALLILSGSGCSFISTPPAKTENQQFNDFTDSLLTKFYSSGDINIIFDFIEPEKYGLKLEEPDLTILSYADYEALAKDYADILKELKTYKLKDLTLTQQETYKVIEYNLQSVIDGLDFYYFNSSELGSFIGTNCDLPYIFIAWPLLSKESLEHMIKVIDNLPVTFQNYIDFEIAKQEKGLPASEPTYKGIASQAQEVVNAGTNYFLIEQLPNRVDEVPGLTAAEVSSYKKRIKDSLIKNYLSAYELIATQIPALADKSPNLSKTGLKHFKKGTDYYAYLLKYNVGVNDSASKIYNYLNKKVDATLKEFRDIYAAHPNEVDAYYTNGGKDSLTLYESDDFKDMIEYLATAYEDGFPKIEKPKYILEEIDASLQENFSPAAFFSPPVDKAYTNLVLVNPSKMSPDTFYTIAHETYPGHLLQFNYADQSDLPLIRKVFHVTGYAEGWAVVAEHYSRNFVKGNDDYLLRMAQLDDDFFYILWAMIDIGVNDKGWGLKETRDLIAKYYGDNISEEDAEYYFNVIQENPTNMLQYYYTYYLMEDYRADFKNRLKGSYSDMLFHQSILEVGSVPLFILKEHLDSIK